MKTMVALRLSERIAQRLQALADKTGRTKTYYAQEAIEMHLEELEDTYLALSRLEKPGRRLSMKEVEAELELVNRVGRKGGKRAKEARPKRAA